MRRIAARHALPIPHAGLFVPMLAVALGCAPALFAQTAAAPAPAVAADVPLRITVTRTVPLRAGQAFAGKLTEPVYGPDRLFLPAGLAVDGIVAATPAADRKTRMNARLDGDFTPLREPVIRVTHITLASGVTLSVDAEGGMRNAETISLARQPQSHSLFARLRGALLSPFHQLKDTAGEPHKGDRLKQLLYSQLPYHPQRIWAGSAFDAVLRRPLTLPLAAPGPPLARAATVDLAAGSLQARLTEDASSASARKGDTISASLIAPFCNPQGSLMLPAGTALHGIVLEAQPARSFGRAGKLRFAFRSISAPEEPAPAAPAATSAAPEAPRHGRRIGPEHAPQDQPIEPDQQDQRIEGSLSSIQAQPGENIALDAEGGARAQPDKGRFLAPLVLGVMAAASQDDDGGIARQGVTSNGFGLFARVVTMAAASRNASTGFAAFAFAKSVYRRWIARGHEVSFPQNTEMTIDLSHRGKSSSQP